MFSLARCSGARVSLVRREDVDDDLGLAGRSEGLHHSGCLGARRCCGRRLLRRAASSRRGVQVRVGGSLQRRAGDVSRQPPRHDWPRRRHDDVTAPLMTSRVT